jgi:hypothetical protein
MEEAPEKGKELSHSAHANGMNEWSKDRNVIKWEHLIFHTYSMPEASYLVEVAKKACAFLLCTLYGSQVTVMKVTLTTFHDENCQQSDTQL